MRRKMGTKVLRAAKARVCVRRGKVRPHPCAVDSLPPKRGVRKLVNLIPRYLLRKEIIDVAFREYLWRCSRVTENIRQPHVLGFDSTLLTNITLAMKEL